MGVILNIYINCLNSKKTLVLLLLNTIITLTYYYLEFVNFSSFNFQVFFELKTCSIFSYGILCISQGLFLWLFIFIELLKHLKLNKSKGILLTHITLFNNRNKYLLSILLGIFFAGVTLSIVNISISLLLLISIFKIINIILIKIFFSSVIFSFIHVMFILVILSFVLLITKNTESSIIIGFIFILFYNLEFFLNSMISSIPTNGNIFIHIVYYFLNIYKFETSIYSYLMVDIFKVPFNLSLGMNNPFIDFLVHTGYYSLSHFYVDKDLGFMPKRDQYSLLDIKILYLLAFLVFSSILMYINIYLYRNQDLSGD